MKTGLATLLAVLSVLLLVAAGLGRQDTSTPVQGDASDVRVVTYNIRHGQGNDDCDDEDVAEGTPSPAQCAVDLERTADIISSLEPDILALQEVDRFWDRSGGVDQATELVESLDMSACFGMNLNHEPDEHADEPHQYGTATLTTFPILDCDNTYLPTPEGWEQRGLLETRVEIDGVGEVAVLNAHLQSDRKGQEEEATRQRTEQAEFIADRIAEIDVPVILMGDFNAEPDSDELASLRNPELGTSDFDAEPDGDELASLQDAWELARDGDENDEDQDSDPDGLTSLASPEGDDDQDQDSDGFTSPASPVEDAERRIDYIFVSGDIEVLSVDVPVTESTRMASDHFPVVADLALVETEATPEPMPTEEIPPAEEPEVIIAPIEEPAETPTPAAEEDALPTDEPVARPTEDQEPTAEPELPPTEKPERTPQATRVPREPTVEPELPPAEEPELPPAEEPDEDAEEATEQAEDEAEEAIEQAEDEAEEAIEQAEDEAEEAIEQAEEEAEDAADD